MRSTGHRPRPAGPAQLAELEAALQRRFERGPLEVYADLLQAAGDPRGSLIALALAGPPEAPRVSAERQRLLEAWLGELRLDAPMVAGSGFVTIAFRAAAEVTPFLASRAAPFVRRIRIHADPAGCAAILDALADRAHPWCIELDLDVHGPEADAIPLPAAIVERVVEATPNLATLRLGGARILHAPIHPGVQQLVLDGPRALIGRPPMPNVTELVLPHLHLRGDRDLHSDLLHPRTFPALRRLDLERNEDHADAVLDLLDRVDRIGALDRLAWLRLPSLRAGSQVRRVLDLLACVPGLEIALARSHRPLRHLLPLDTPRLLVPDPVPCAPYATFGLDLLAISVPGHGWQFEFSLGGIADATECHFASFSSEQQAAWTALWDRLPALTAAPIGFPAAAMAHVVDTMMLTDLDAMIGLAPWQDLQHLLRQLPCAVLLSRLAG